MTTLPGDGRQPVTPEPAATPVRPSTAPPVRTVRTRPVDLVGTLLQRLPRARGVLAWVPS